jgi:peptide/nickel transport system permease protein
MARYLLKRIVYFIFTLFLVSLVAFAVTVYAPGDPVDRLLNGAAGQEMSSNAAVSEKHRAGLRHQLGLDLPLFYISVQSAAEPDTLCKIFPRSDRNTVKLLTRQYGHWQKVSAYYRSILDLQDQVANRLPVGQQ